MKRRGFLSIIAGAIGLPVAAKRLPGFYASPELKAKGYVVVVDYARDTVNLSDRHTERVFQHQNGELKLVGDLNDWLGKRKSEEMVAKFGASSFGKIKS